MWAIVGNGGAGYVSLGPRPTCKSGAPALNTTHIREWTLGCPCSAIPPSHPCCSHKHKGRTSTHEGDTRPHTRRYVWPLATAVEALTSDSPEIQSDLLKVMWKMGNRYQ